MADAAQDLTYRTTVFSHVGCKLAGMHAAPISLLQPISTYKYVVLPWLNTHCSFPLPPLLGSAGAVAEALPQWDQPGPLKPAGLGMRLSCAEPSSH